MPDVLIDSIRPGESLYEVFNRHRLSQADLMAMVGGNRQVKARLRRLMPGQRVAVHASSDGMVQRVYLQMPGPRDLAIERAENGFELRDVSDAAEFFTAPAVEPGNSSVPTQAQDEPGVRSAPAIVPPDTESPATSARPEVTSVEPPAVDDTHDDIVHHISVKPGDSLFLIFKRLRLPSQDLARVLEADASARQLQDLKPGQELTLVQSSRGELRRLAVPLDLTQTLHAARTADGFKVDIAREHLERRVANASAVIEDSLFVAGQREGLSDRVIMELVEIFGWDIDFALDVRVGDRFTVIFEEFYRNGEKVLDGSILASEFVNRGRSVRALRYVDDSGRAQYFSPDGLSMRKAFLRTPVNFSRISSRFSSGRMHPVLQRMRAHMGVDYAAPTGTPVRASGDGRVTFAGWKGGYGRALILQHGATYTTLYGHLSGIRKGIGSGVRVRQGEIIGFVGQTGLATGPHLHYEFRVRGVHQDPLNVKLPKALPIEARYRNDFLRQGAPLVAQLEALARTSVASSD